VFVLLIMAGPSPRPSHAFLSLGGAPEDEIVDAPQLRLYPVGDGGEDFAVLLQGEALVLEYEILFFDHTVATLLLLVDGRVVYRSSQARVRVSVSMRACDAFKYVCLCLHVNVYVLLHCTANYVCKPTCMRACVHAFMHANTPPHTLAIHDSHTPRAAPPIRRATGTF